VIYPIDRVKTHVVIIHIQHIIDGFKVLKAEAIPKVSLRSDELKIVSDALSPSLTNGKIVAVVIFRLSKDAHFIQIAPINFGDESERAKIEEKMRIESLNISLWIDLVNSDDINKYLAKCLAKDKGGEGGDEGLHDRAKVEFEKWVVKKGGGPTLFLMPFSQKKTETFSSNSYMIP
jgi:hypothetical protein